MNPAPAGGWRPQRLLTAPHRLGFALGTAAMGLLALWWLTVLAVTSLGLAPPWAVPPALAHALLFAFGFMPAFMSGFLFTAGPRWLDRPPVEARGLLPALLQLGVGLLMALAGVHTVAALAAFGLAMMATGWLRLTLRAAALLRASRVPDRRHARGIVAACAVGVGAMALASAALWTDDAALLRAAVQLGLWGFLVPVFAVASHRMLPFVDGAALPLAGGLLLAGLAEAGWLPAVLLAPLLAAASLALLLHAGRWALQHGLGGASRRLLAMLFGGFVWLALAVGLQAVSQALQAAGRPGLGTAPLHALTLGWLGCTLIAMVTRVAAGHSGRPLAIDRWGWALFQLLMLGVLLRVAAALGWGLALLPAAALWAVVTAGWGWRQGRWLGCPRVDGRLNA